MKIEPLPPIPSPPEHHWRQFRVKVAPYLSFALVFVLAVWLWGRNLANPLIVGQAEGAQANIVSPVAGRVAQIHVNLYQEVQAGDVIAIVDASDPLILSNTIALIHAELEATRADAGFGPGDKVRYAQFQMDWLAQRAKLAELRGDLLFSQLEFDRVSKLAKDEVDPQRDLDYARSQRDRFQGAVDEQAVAVATAEKALLALAPTNNVDESASVKAAIAVANQSLRLAESELQPVALRAPISGYITKIEALPQGTVVRGGAIATIASSGVDRIVGFIGQPIRVEPRVGMKAIVRSRGINRVAGDCLISHVGPRIELFDAPLRVRGMGAAQERGLPIVVTVPPNLHLRPGEFVEITLMVD